MRITIFFILLSCFLNSKAQNLFGSYMHKSTDQLSATTTISFFKNKTFTKVIKSDMGEKIGRGKFKKTGNFLLLYYEDQNSIDTSKYVLSSTTIANSSVAQIEINVFDKQTNSPLMSTYGCRDTRNNIIFHHLTDTQGIGNITLNKHKAIKYFTIDCLGYRRISIPTTRLSDKSTKINAFLEPEEVIYVD